MTHEDFQKEVSEITDLELSQLAYKAVSRLCKTGGQSFTMTVPPRKDDTDIVLSELNKRFMKLSGMDIKDVLRTNP